MKNFYPLTLHQTVSLIVASVLLGLCASVFSTNAQNGRAQIGAGPKGEAPTMAVRCYASDVSVSQLQIELQYLQDFGWQDIAVRNQPGTQSLMKVTARAFYTFESRDAARFDEILNVNAAAKVVTCG
jgi:hypothetical protein